MDGALVFFTVVLWLLIVGVVTTAQVLWEMAVDTARLVRRVLLRRRAVPAAARCPVCSGDFESCSCGTPTNPLPRTVPSWAKDGAR